MKCYYCGGELVEYALDSKGEVFSHICTGCGHIQDYGGYCCLLCGVELEDYHSEICDECAEKLENDTPKRIYYISNPKTSKRVHTSYGIPTPLFTRPEKAVAWIEKNRHIIKDKEVLINEFEI